MSRRPIFLDRDGVINVDISPYVCRIEDLEIFPYTRECLRRLDAAGFDIYVVSNQQGVALGLTPPEVLDQIDAAFQALVAPLGFMIQKFYYATAHDREDHPWRKPSPGMILAARDEFGLSIDGAYMIGDKDTDMECGARAGCIPLLVRSGVTPGWEDATRWPYPPNGDFPTLVEAVDYVLSQT